MQEYIKKILGSGHRPSSSASPNHPSFTAIIISNYEMKDIIKIAKSRGVTETVQNEVKEQKGRFLVCY